MIEVNLLELFLIILIVVAFLSIATVLVWDMVKRTTTPVSSGRLYGGTAIISIPTAIALIVATAKFVPKDTLVSADGSYKSYYYVLNDLGKTPFFDKTLTNDTGQGLLVIAIGYGDKKNYNEKYIVMPGESIDFDHSLWGVNEEPPSKVYTKSDGLVRWYAFTESFLGRPLSTY